MGKGAGDVGIGYYYHLSMHMVLCAGPVDKISRIKAGDYLIWGPVLGVTGIDNSKWVWVPDENSGIKADIAYTAAFPLVKQAGAPDVYVSALSGNSSTTKISNAVNLAPSDYTWVKSFLDSFDTTTQEKPALTATNLSGTDKVEGQPDITVTINTSLTDNTNWGKVGSSGLLNSPTWVYPATVGRVSGNGRIIINNRDAFGGKKREGGFSGSVRVMMGGLTQTASDFLTKHTTPVLPSTPAFRGVTSLIWEDCYYSANTVRPKPWSVEVTRISKRDWIYQGVKGAPDYIDYAVISNESSQGEHANPAHIIAECLTSFDWGLGYSEDSIDMPSFIKAAKTLYAEELGLSILWNSVSSVEEFINIILQHINAVVFVDPQTDKFVLKLIRNDYAYETLPLFNENDVISVADYIRTGTSDLVNQVTVQWVDAVSNKWQSMTRTNSALREQQGSVIAVTKQYPGVATRKLASKLLSRDVSILSQPLASVTLTVNRKGSSLLPGDVIVWKWRDLGIGSYAVAPYTETPPRDGMILRISSVSYGTLTDGKITLECIEDIFGADNVRFTDSLDVDPTDPVDGPANALSSNHIRAVNATYVDMLKGAIKAGFDLARLPPVSRCDKARIISAA